MTEPGASALGEMIRKQRELASMTMRQLSSMAGISNPYLSQIEHGVREPSQAVLRQIAVSLGLDPAELKDRDNPNASGVIEAIDADEGLTAAQRRALKEVHASMIAATQAKRTSSS